MTKKKATKSTKATKTTKKKATKAKKATKKVVRKKTSPKERAQAVAIDLTVSQHTVLRAIASSPNGLSYKQIEKKTGIYKPLTLMCRPTHDGSLGTLDYVTEEEHDINNRDVLIFKITKVGKAALEKAKKI